MGLLEDCNTHFGTKDLYQVLSLDKSATNTQIKKAYKKASLLNHPDKVDDSQRDSATRKFQVLSKVHYLLSDTQKRELYDESGLVDDDDTLGSCEDGFWDEYWRTLFPKITLKDIDNFMKQYKGSEEEMEDLKKCYLQFEGDMNKISECFIGYQNEEEEKYCQILNDLIEEEQIPAFPKFVNETDKKKLARRKKYKKEAALAKRNMKIFKEEQSLADAIKNRAGIRRRNFNELISHLEAKYGQVSYKRIAIESNKIYQEAPKQFKKEESAAAKASEESSDTSALMKAMAKRGQERESQFNSLIANLESKYGQADAKKTKKKK